jgi:folate-binding protein YgfZ
MHATTMTKMDVQDYQALTQGAALIARGVGDVIRLSDADRHDFLHRMTTNAINGLPPGRSVVTVLTSPTARILFVFTVLARQEDLLLLPAPGQGGALARHLRGQIFFMDKVKLQDVGNDWARLRLVGAQAATVAAACGLPVADLPNGGWVAREEVIALAQGDYDLPGYELLVSAARHADLRDRLLATGATPVGPAAVEARRVELGRPAPGAELTEEVNPLEAGLAWTCADNKGCYTGQEIIARQITYDKVTKSLVGLRSAALLKPGSEVRAEGRSAGVVTSATYSPALDAPIALAIVKRPYNQPGTTVQVVCDNAGNDAHVVALPFA